MAGCPTGLWAIIAPCWSLICCLILFLGVKMADYDIYSGMGTLMVIAAVIIFAVAFGLGVLAGWYFL